MDTSHTSTTCMVRIADQQWRNSEVSLGARSLLVRAVDGSAPVEWLPYDDVANVTEVDDPETPERFIEVTAQDGRRLSMQLGQDMLTALLAALAESTGRPEEPAPRPAEFGIGANTTPPATFSTTPPSEVVDPVPATSIAPPPQTGSTEPVVSGSRRTWLLLGALLVVIALVAVGLFVLLGGDDDGTDPVPAPPTTDAPDIEAQPGSDAQTTTTVPTEPDDDGPAGALSVDVEDVVIDAGGESPAVYLAFATTNETARNVSAYDLEVALTASDTQGRDIAWPVQFRCASPLVAEGTRTGSFSEQAAGADLDALVDCRVGAWPLDPEDPAQAAFAEAVAADAPWDAEVRVVSVEFTDGTVLE